MNFFEFLFKLNFIQISIIITLFVFALMIGFFIGKIIKYKEILSSRMDAVKRSKGVILGEVYEKVIPFLPNFKYSPKDMVFIGKGFDYLVLEGLSEGNLKNIIFLEIKSGKSNLNKNEKMIQKILGEKKVRYEEFRI
ncbi:hypothetical protein KAZ01_00380 [Candidatus Gracilibacteria bacterium]|nr:hypothetical protein [Candidatus Gracilibacteria bacterium]